MFVLVFITILAIILVLNINSIKNPLLIIALLLLWVLLSFFIIKYLCLKLINKIIYLKNTWKMNIRNELETKFNEDLNIIKNELETKFNEDLNIIKNELETKLIKYITTTHLSECSFVSQDCTAGELYRQLNLPYLSPFTDLMLKGSAFSNFLENIPSHLSQAITFISRNNALIFKEENGHILVDYPVFQLGTPNMEIHWIHSNSEEDVQNKWNRRKERINYDKIITINASEEYQDKFFRDIQFNDSSIVITKNSKKYTFPTREKKSDEGHWNYRVYQIQFISKSFEILLLLI